MASTTRVVVAEPDSALRRVLTRRLEAEGCHVRGAESSDDVIGMLDDFGADALVVAMWPGSAFLPEVRDQTDVVVIAMLPRDTPEVDALDVLDAGADDFVVKPFSPRELVARLHARMRRVATPAQPTARRFTFGDLTIDEGRREVLLRGELVTLPAKEFDLLLFLAASPRQVFSRGQLMAQVWGIDAAVTTATITEHIRRLRNRIEKDPKQPRWIETVWSVGYRFNPGGGE